MSVITGSFYYRHFFVWHVSLIKDEHENEIYIAVLEIYALHSDLVTRKVLISSKMGLKQVIAKATSF